MKSASCLTLLLVLPISVLLCQHKTWESLTIDDGLSQGMIYDIIQTRDGFLWIATKDGLNRYDGYNFKVWTNNTANPFSLPDNTITALFEDSRGLLWIGSENKRVQLFDRKTNRFHYINLPVIYNKGNLVSYDVLCILEDKRGYIWMANRGGGVFRLQIPDAWAKALPDTPDLSHLAQLVTVPIPPAQLSEPGAIEEYRALLAAKDGSIWIGTSQNLYRVDARSLAVTKIQKPPGLPRETWSLVQPPAGDIWGACSTGVFRHRKGAFSYFSFPLDRVSHDTYPAFSVGKDGQVWVIFETQLFQISETGELNPQKPDYVLDRASNVLLQDNEDNVWIGTLGYGLRKVILRKALFNPMLEGISVWGVWKNKDGRLLCKLFNKIVPYDFEAGKLSEESAFPDALPQQNDLLFEPDGAHWLLGGLREGTVNESELRHYRADGTLVKSYDITALGRNTYSRLMRARDGAIWLSGGYGRLMRLDPRTGRQSFFDFGALFGENQETLTTIALAQDGRGDIWVGTQYGLVKGTLAGEKMNFELIKAAGQNDKTPNNNSIACIFPDPEKPAEVLWIGTKGGGINRLDLETETFSYITTEQGLPNDVVYGILYDNSGHFWCSTNRGLVKMRMEGGRPVSITPFTAGDGLQSNEFNTQAFFKAPSGELLFGGVNGINRFLPEKLQFSDQPPQVYITGLKVNNLPSSSFEAGADRQQGRCRIELGYAENNLSIEFAAMDFTAPGKNQYRYQLLPIEKGWSPARTDRFAHFTHLAPGRYVFRVQGSNSVGVWNETPVEMEIVINPPWWRSNIACLLYVLALAGIVWQLWRFQVGRVKMREQLAFEHRETERVKALEQLKTNFFSNVTHEFRTPLSLILEPARRILADAADTEIRTNAAHIETNSLRLLDLVNQLLDLAKLEDGSMKVELRRGDFAEAVRETYQSFLPLAEKRGVELSLSIAADVSYLDFDAQKVELILNNLLSNALKFTPEGGKVSVEVRRNSVRTPVLPAVSRNSVAASVLLPAGRSGVPAPVLPDSGTPSLLVSVSDTGIGIPAAELDKIFDRFYQADGAHTHAGEGTGIGLALSRELAQLMGGTIIATSEQGKGSTFTFRLPFTAAFPAQVRDTTEVAAAKAPKIELESPSYQRDSELPVALVIEDNPDLRSFIRQSIEAYWQVVETSNGREGVERAVELIPDLVISDLMMPVKDGYEVCEELKNNELTAHIPIILLTARANMDAKLKGLRTGADDYLTKPFNTEELLARMENLLQLRRRLRERFSNSTLSDTAADAGEEQSFLSPPDQEFLRRFTLLIEENLADEKIGVEEFAQKMFVSRSQLHRKLKAIADQNVTDFIRSYRLERAMQMLKDGEGMVNEVASRVGFGNEKYFSTAFKDKFGVSPSRVR
jgi:signal transduction histidine kinase/DNA-binding response OmpR family regulator/ligand-binding sensor domain-containing protein